MNKFEQYNSSQIVPQRTLLEKFNKLIGYLSQNPNINVFRLKENYDVRTTTYDITKIGTHGKTVGAGDVVLFNNSFVGVIESVGPTTVTVLGGVNIKGEKGDDGEDGQDGQDGIGIDDLSLVKFSLSSITYQDGTAFLSGTGTFYYDDEAVETDLQFQLTIEGSDYINVDANEDETGIVITLDQDVVNKLNRALVTPLSPPAEPKLVSIGTNNAQTNLGIGDGLEIAGGKLKATGGGGGGGSNFLVTTDYLADISDAEVLISSITGDVEVGKKIISLNDCSFLSIGEITEVGTTYVTVNDVLTNLTYRHEFNFDIEDEELGYSLNCKAIFDSNQPIMFLQYNDMIYIVDNLGGMDVWFKTTDEDYYTQRGILVQDGGSLILDSYGAFMITLDELTEFTEIRRKPYDPLQ